MLNDDKLGMKALVLLLLTLLAACNQVAFDSGETAPATPDVVVPQFACPSGYIEVPGEDFCVMAYEASNDSGAPKSVSDVTPWVNITYPASKTACDSLNTDPADLGEYALISNDEWTTIARNLENVNSNWSGGTVGSGCLKRGNSGGWQNGICSDNIGYVGIAFGASRGPLAELTLSNGKKIYDFSGNVWEFVDWDIPYNMKAGSSSVGGDDFEFTDLDLKVGSGDPMALSNWGPSNPAFNSSNEVGFFNRGRTDNIATDYIIPMRGGANYSGTGGGVFTLNTTRDGNPWWDPDYGDAGFRCVYRKK